MKGRLVAYTAYALGSAVFLTVGLSRGSWLIAAGSALFLLGTLLLLVLQLRQSRTSGAFSGRARRSRRRTARGRPAA